MFTKHDIDSAILYLDNEIRQYAVTFDKEKQDFDSLTHNISYIENERTVAFYTNHRINDYLISQGYQVSLFASEFSISINNGLSNSLFKTLISEVAKSKQSVPWKRCYVDGYFKIKDFIEGNQITHLFIEYKMDNKFVYLELATDYLKYKAITYANESGTVFVYSIFKKQANYPSILSASAPHYEFIGKTITSSSISGTKKVYIYLPGRQTIATDKKTPKEIEMAIDVMNRVTYLSSKVETLKDRAFAEIKEDKLIFVKSMKLFNSKVAKSNTVRKHYGFIKAVWDKCEEIKLFGNLEDIFKDSNEPITPELIIREGSYYKTNLGNNITSSSKKAAIKKGLRTATNVSLFIVAIIDYFNKRFGIGVQSPDYGEVPLGRGKNKDKISLKETVDYFNERLDKNYFRNDEGNRRLKKLSYSLMYFIVNLYQTIYVIDDNNKVGDYKGDFNYYLVLERLQESLDYAMRKLNFKKKEINVEDIVEKDQSKSRDNLIEFVNWVLNQY